MSNAIAARRMLSVSALLLALGAEPLRAAAPVDDARPESGAKDHWAFKAPTRPPVPRVQPALRNPIDAFLEVEREKRGLNAQGPADKRLLLRRVYLDLIGLPPTLDEQAAFLTDRSLNAFEKVVDRLLASKQYGERWGRHWMDVWRYSDPWGLGAEIRNSQKHIWHWRDWIIESLNADKGYDQMLREMLAADELYPTDSDRLRASGFLARQYFKFNRNTWLEEVVEHTSKAFLGLTMNCSKCHDHKYDPIAQQDFYRLRAFFEPYQVRTDMVPGEIDFEKDGLPRAFDCHLDAPTYLFIRGDERQPRKDQLIAPGVPAILAFEALAIKPVALPIAACRPELREMVVENHLRAAKQRVEVARQAVKKATDALRIEPRPMQPFRQLVLNQRELASKIASLHAAEWQLKAIETSAAASTAQHQRPPALKAQELAQIAAQVERRLAIANAAEAVAKADEALARADWELSSAVDDKKLTPEQKRAADKEKKGPLEKKLAAARDLLAKAEKELEAPGDKFTPLRGALKTLESNLETEASRHQPFPTTSSGRRTALAAWLTDQRNPLTARVAVNHLWARHFGKPLVATVFDFGRKGAAPTHPELLDYLAVELCDNGWSMKKLHRLMVTSQAYRMTSSSAAAGANLAVDAENRYLWRMNPIRMEGEVVRDSLLALAGELDLTMGGPPLPVTDETTRRRSLYIVHSHNDHHMFLSTFDAASVLECYRRAESIVPQQALTLENSKLAMAAAAKIAARLRQPNDAEFIKAAFELLLGSSPTTEEQAECARALKELQEIAAQDKKPDGALRARVNLVHALLNHNDFVTIR
jgi:hypothetical protein